MNECHRTQSGKLHLAMKTIMPYAVFVGFTGTPLLKSDKATSIEVFGRYIHSYKFDEGVADGAVLDLRYEYRDIPQEIMSQDRIDAWFEAKTCGLMPRAKARLKQIWGNMQTVYSSRSRLEKIVCDIIFDFETKARLADGSGNAILVADDILTACKYYELFQQKNFRKCAVISSYEPSVGGLRTETVSDDEETDAYEKYRIYLKMIGIDPDATADKSGIAKRVEEFEKAAKKKFIEEPYNMKLLIVVDKLLTGFDAPPCTYLYIDKTMHDHGLFQAICRVNRLDGEDKDFGYIVDYKQLFGDLSDAMEKYTSGAFEGYADEDVEGLLKDCNYNAQSIYENTAMDFIAPEPSYEQVAELEGTNGIDKVFPFYLTKTQVSVNGVSRTTTVLLSDQFQTVGITMYNEARVIEKASAEVENPIYIDWQFANDTGAKLGDTVSFAINNKTVEFQVYAIYETNTIYNGGAILAQITAEQATGIRNSSVNNGYSGMYIHDVHRAVANVAEHIDTLELTELVCNRRKALRKNIRTRKFNVVANAFESEVGAVVLQEIFLEAVLLFTYPSQRKSRSKVDTGRGQLTDVQLTGNSGKGENIVVAVCHFVGDKFLVFLTDKIVSALIDKQIALEGWLLVVGGYARLKATMGGLDVSVAVVDADDNGIGVVVVIFLKRGYPLFGFCHGCLQGFLLSFIFGKQGIKAFIGNAPDGKGFIEFLDDIVKLGNTLLVLAQPALGFLRCFLLLNLRSGAHLFGKFFLIGYSKGTDGTDGIQNKLPNCLRADIVTAAGVGALLVCKSISGAIVKVRGIRVILRAASGTVIGHLCSAVRTEQKARQGIGFAQSVVSPWCLAELLCKFPSFLINDGFVGVLKDQPFLFGIHHRDFVLVRLLVGAEVHRMPHIFRLCKDVPDNITAPVIRIGKFLFAFPNAPALPCGIDRRGFDLVIKQDAGNVIRAFALNGQPEDATDNLCRYLINQPVILVLRVFLVAVDGAVGGGLARFALDTNGGALFAA